LIVFCARLPSASYAKVAVFLADAAMIAALLVIVGMPCVLLRYGQRDFDTQLSLLGETTAMLGLGIYVIGYVRLTSVFPAVEIGRYAGIRDAWKQTSGNN
jgi:hypothetical protein